MHLWTSNNTAGHHKQRIESYLAIANCYREARISLISVADVTFSSGYTFEINLRKVAYLSKNSFCNNQSSKNQLVGYFLTSITLAFLAPPFSLVYQSHGNPLFYMFLRKNREGKKFSSVFHEPHEPWNRLQISHHVLLIKLKQEYTLHFSHSEGSNSSAVIFFCSFLYIALIVLSSCPPDQMRTERKS
jgi:hypothetical protein